jgi:hypothetical protein
MPQQLKSWSQKSRLPERKRQTILVTILIQTVRTCTCILHARTLHTARSLVFVLGGTDDAAAAGQLEPDKQTARERADADNTGNDSDSSGAHLRYAYCTLHAHLFLF